MTPKKYIVEAIEQNGGLVPTSQPVLYVEQPQLKPGDVITKEVYPSWITLTIWGVIIFLFLFALITMVNFVQEKTIRVVQRLGKFKKLLHPGLGFKLPFIDSVAGVVNLQIQQLNVDVETKTVDNVIVVSRVAVQYFIQEAKAKEAFYDLKNPQEQIRSFILDAVRAKVPTMTLDQVFASKADIAKDIKESLTPKLEKYGYEISDTLVTDISGNKEVMASMNSIEVQKRTKEANEHEGEAKKILVVKAAEADREKARLEGEGIALARKAIVDGLNEAVSAFAESSSITSKEALATVLAAQYMDTMKSMGEHGGTIFMDSNVNGGNKLIETIASGMLAASKNQ